MYKLIIEDDEGKTTVVPLIRDEITIGRKEGNTIRLTERNVSRRHARLSRQNGALFIEDAQSYNGIKLNGARISGKSPVQEGDRIQIGDYLLAVQLDHSIALEATADVPTAVADSGEQTRTDQVKTQALPATQGAEAGVGAEAVDVKPTAQQPAALSGASPRASNSPVQSVDLRLAPTAPVAAVAGPIGAAAAAGVAPQTPLVGSPASAASLQPSPAPAPASVPHEAANGHGATVTKPGHVVPDAAEHPARLVVLSSNFAGKEFPLEGKSSFSIGRTDENDIVIQHRSISRHHAKVSVEQGRFSIADQHSSNGVRVNGEDYGQVELRKGDLIDLGHIRLRFVEPGEDFLFGRDAEIQDVVVRKRGGVVLLAGMVLAFLVGCVCIAAFSGLLPRRATTAVADGNGAAKKAGDSGPTPTAAVDPAEEQGRLAEASQALKEERWDDALAASAQLLAKQPTSAAAEELRNKAASEKASSLLFEQFKAAEQAGKFADVVTRFNAIAPDSIYKSRAQPAYTKLRGEYIESNLKQADTARRRGACDEVRRIVDLVLSVDENNPRAATLVAQCSRPGERKPPPTAAAGPRVAALAPTAAGGAPTAAGTSGSGTPSTSLPAPSGEPGATGEARTPRTEVAPTPSTPPSSATASIEPPPVAPKGPKRSSAAAATTSTGGSDAQLAQLLADAETAWVRQQYNTAIDYAERALKIDPNSPRAIQLIGAVSCTLNDGQRAAWAHRRLDQGRRRLLRLVCDRAGVELP